MIKPLRGLVAAAVLGLSTAAAGAAEAPFGDKVGAGFTNYNRAAPRIGSAGTLQPGAVARAKALGFRTIIDLRSPDEGVAAERDAAKAAGITHISIPVATLAPLDSAVSDFARTVEDPANLPVLVHCSSANRVGAMWALYRASKGVPPQVAVEEGRTLGLKSSRETGVRIQLDLLSK